MPESLALGQWVLLFVVVFVAAGVQGALGFGFGLVALPVMGYLMPARTPQVLILVGLPAVLYVVWQERAIRFGSLRWVLLGRVLGTAPGALLVALLPLAGLQITFSVAMIVAVAAMSLSPGAVSVRPRTEVAAGIVSGVMATATSLGGPVLAVLYSGLEHHRLRGVMAWVLLIGNLLSLSGLRAAGRLGLADVATTAVLLVPVALGVRLGSRLLARLNQALVRKLVLALVMAAALFLMLQAAAPILTHMRAQEMQSQQ